MLKRKKEVPKIAPAQQPAAAPVKDSSEDLRILSEENNQLKAALSTYEEMNNLKDESYYRLKLLSILETKLERIANALEESLNEESDEAEDGSDDETTEE